MLFHRPDPLSKPAVRLTLKVGETSLWREFVCERKDLGMKSLEWNNEHGRIYHLLPICDINIAGICQNTGDWNLVWIFAICRK